MKHIRKKQQINRWIAGGAGATAALLALPSHASAQSSDAIINKLVEKGVLTQNEAADLKKDSEKDFTKSFFAHSGMPAWTKSVTFSGDLRLRLDDQMFEDSLDKPNRLRYRYRLRYGGVWAAQDWVTVGFRLGSGDFRSALSDGNPNSNNQTATHAFSKKPLYVDAAYVTLKPPGQDWISVTAGKMNNQMFQPAFTSPIVYDPDLTPEGAIEQLNFKFGDSKQYSLFANVSELVLDELSSNKRDVYMYDGQAGFSAGLLGDPKDPALKLTLAGGYFGTQNLTDMPVADNSGNVGNSVSGANYLGDFQVVYGRGEAAWRICDQPFLGTPAIITVSGEYDKNLNDAYQFAGDDQTTAWTGQIMFGKASKKGQWQIAYQYRRVEANSVFDSLTDDDFGGGTDRKGHVIKAFYNIRDWWSVDAAAFITEKITGRTGAHTQAGLEGQTQTHLYFDTVFKF
jgi:hypothetical protein